MSRIVTPSKPKLDAEENEEEGNKKEKSLVAQLQNSEEITDVEKEAMREALRSMTADEAFAAFDADDDGLVDFNEFRSIIPYLNVKISDAKAFRYFKMCDTRQCQKIDVDDFKAALFACDPVSTFFFYTLSFHSLTSMLLVSYRYHCLFPFVHNYRPKAIPLGFNHVVKSVYLMPLKPSTKIVLVSLMKMNSILRWNISGMSIITSTSTKCISPDITHVVAPLSYTPSIRYKLNDKVSEDAFAATDYDQQGTIDWEEFRNLFTQLCDVRKELEDRDVELPTFVPSHQLRHQLKGLLSDEEVRERRAVAEAKRYMAWTFLVRDKRRFLLEAHFRAYRELRNALDAAGHVYVFGKGANKQFQSNTLEMIATQDFQFEHFERILELWTDRINPQQLVNRCKASRNMAESEARRDEDKAKQMGAVSGIELQSLKLKKKVVIDPYREALTSEFKKVITARNTAALWGRRVHHVAMSESVVLALADSGEVFVFGGKGHWWDEIQPDSIYQTKWKGDVTNRSQLVLGIRDRLMPRIFSKKRTLGSDEMSPDDKRQEVIKVVCKYFGCWEPPPNPATRDIYFDRELLPKIEYDDIKCSLFCRGKTVVDKTKMELIELLHDDIVLETKLLGERGHRMVKKLEAEYSNAIKRNEKKLADKSMVRLDDIWKPLREMQAESRAAAEVKAVLDANEAMLNIERDYVGWRQRTMFNRDEIEPTFTPRGEGLEVVLHGVTPRGPEMSTPRAYQAGVQVAAGNSHACLVHRSGHLYPWGLGAAGRLGQDMSNGDGNPQSDVMKPKLVEALAGRPVVRVSAGFAHTGAITLGGHLFMWGSVAGGKCGLGPIVDKAECYCSVPTKIMVGANDNRVARLSCGAGHTGVVTENGRLYMFGCGDGGRLGLGDHQLVNTYVPTLVESLAREHISSVSCGNSATIAITAITSQVVNEDGVPYKKLVGGHVYIAGSSNVLGRQYSSFTLLDKFKDKVMSHASVGFRHCLVVSNDGELYTWGHNDSGCLGFPESIRFLSEPSLVKSMHNNAEKISLNVASKQSSVYNMRDSNYAVNGDTSGKGLKKCSCTQLDKQAWIELDLGDMTIIETIKVWNRTDTPADRSQRPDFYTSRLFPCWVMVGNDPFSQMPDSLAPNLRDAVAKMQFTVDQRVSTWHCLPGTQGRYVRVQLEGANFLNLAELEVYGNRGFSTGVGRVSYALAGRDATIVVIRPSADPKHIEKSYCRAVYADARNADILRQYETYALEYDKFGRGEVLMGKCMTCIGSMQCETCSVYEQYATELEHMPKALGGKRHTLAQIESYLINAEKPPLKMVSVPKKVRPGWYTEQLRKLIADARATIGLKPKPKLPPPPPQLENNVDEEQKQNSKRELEEEEDDMAHSSILSLADNRIMGAMPKQTNVKFKRRMRRVRRNQKGNELSIPSVGGGNADHGTLSLQTNVEKTPFVSPIISSVDKKSVRFDDSSLGGSPSRSPLSPSMLSFLPSPEDRKLMPANATFKSALPKAILARKQDDLETKMLIEDIKLEAERQAYRRKTTLSMGTSSRAPSSAAGRASDASLVGRSSKAGR